MRAVASQHARVVRAQMVTLPGHHWSAHPESPFFQLPAAYELDGELVLPALQAAVERLVERHESLRTTFARVDGLLVQEIHPRLAPELRALDVSRLAGAEQDAAVAEALAHGRRPFDVFAEAPLRVAVVRRGPRRAVLSLVLHHLVADGWSVRIVTAELAALYAAALDGVPAQLPPPAQLRAFAAWQRERAAATRAEQAAWWRAQLAGLPREPPLPAARSRAGVAEHETAIATAAIPADVVAGLRRLAAAGRATLYMVLLAALDAALAVWTGARDLAVGTVVAGRKRPEHESVVGLCINHVVLRTRIAGDPTFAEMLALARAATLGAFAHDDLPYAHLWDVLDGPAPARFSARWPVWLVLQPGVGAAPALPGATLTPWQAPPGPPLVQSADAWQGEELQAIVTPAADASLRLALHYNARLHDRATMDALAARVVAVAARAVARPEARLSELARAEAAA